MGEIISIISQKGGVGKTTTTVNLGASLSQKGCRVLLVDLDPQGQISTSFNIGKYETKSGIYNFVIEGKNLEEVIHRTSVENLDYAALNIGLHEFDRIDEISERSHFLAEPLTRIKYRYDYILIDCPPSLNKLAFNALLVSDSVIVPIQCEFYALKALGELMKVIQNVKNNYNPYLKYRGFLVTMVDLRSNLSKLVLDRLRYMLDNLVFKTVIPRNIKLAEVPMCGKPAVLIDKNSKGARSYLKLANEILNQDGTIESPLSKHQLRKAENY